MEKPSAGALAASNQAMTAEQARERVLEPALWQKLDGLARRRFPNDANLADESLLYLLDELQRDDWFRVREYRGQSSFATFIAVICSRLLADFTRKRFGHIRMPKRVAQMAGADPLCGRAYELLFKHNWARSEVRAQLHAMAPERSLREIDALISEVRALTANAPRFSENAVSLEALEGAGVQHASVPAADAADELLALIAARILHDPVSPDIAKGITQRLPASARARFGRLIRELDLPAEDALLLRLRFVDSLSVNQAASRLGLEGDAFKRLNRALARLRRALASAGIVSAADRP